MAHNAFPVIDQLRGFLTEACSGYHFVYKMADHEVVRAVAGELVSRTYQVVIEPGHGWAVRVNDTTDQVLMPVSVEPAPELAPVFKELKHYLDELVAEQRKKYNALEAKLAKMSEAERAALYSGKAGSGLWDATIGGLVDMVKAVPGFYKGYLKTLRKIALYPAQLAAVTAEAIATGSMGPLKEIDKVVKPLADGYEAVKKYKGMLQVLLSDEQTLDLLHDFAKRYYDATHPLELTEMGASAAADIVVTVILAILTAGVGAAANVAAKSGRLAKVAKLLERLAKLLKRIGARHKLSKKRAKKTGTALGANRKTRKPNKGNRAKFKNQNKADKLNETTHKAEKINTQPNDSKRITKGNQNPGGNSDKYGKFVNKDDIPPKYRKDDRIDSLSSDPDQGGKITSKTRQEAMAGLEAESQGLLKKPIERGPKGIEFYDGDGKPWDVKAPPSPQTDARWKFNAKKSGASILDELRKPGYPNKLTGELEKRRIILDNSYINKKDHKALWDYINEKASKEELDRIVEITTEI